MYSSQEHFEPRGAIPFLPQAPALMFLTLILVSVADLSSFIHLQTVVDAYMFFYSFTGLGMLEIHFKHLQILLLVERHVHSFNCF